MIKKSKQADEFLFAKFDRLTSWQPSKTAEILLGICCAVIILQFLVM